MMNKTNITISKFLVKVSKYNPIPALIKNSPCDYNAKLCQKHGYVKLIKSTKTGNTYALTQKGIKFAEKELSSK